MRKSERFWTSTPFAKYPKKEAWRASMVYGEAEHYITNRSYSARCVRGQLTP